LDNFVQIIKHKELHSTYNDQKNHTGNQVDFCATGAASGLFLSGSYFTYDPFFLSSCTHLFAVCHPGSENSWSHPGISDDDQPDSALSPLGYKRV